MLKDASRTAPFVAIAREGRPTSISTALLLLPPLAPGILAVLALLLRLFDLSKFALWGDEFATVREATSHFGSNLTSVPYLVVLRAFMVAGNSPEVMRLPAVLFGVAAVPALYLLASSLVDRRTGLIAALLMATSPFAVNYSQEVRFYTLFLLSSLLALHALVRVLRLGPTWQRLAWLAAANLFCLATDPIGILVVGGEVIAYVVATTPRDRLGRRALLLLASVLVAALLMSSSEVRAWGFHLLTRVTATKDTYTGARGLHLTSVLKIGWTFYVFAFGKRVYPLWLWITLPGAVFVAFMVARGLWSRRSDRLFLSVVLPQVVLSPVLLYLVFDALMAPGSQPAASRYLIPMLGPFLLLLATGIASWRPRRNMVISIAAALALNCVALVAYWDNAWNYTGDAPNWQGVAALVARDASPGGLVLVDPTSRAPTQYYLRDIERAHGLTQTGFSGATVAAAHASRVFVISNSGAPGEAITTFLLDRLQRRYVVRDGFVEYPLFVYVFDRKPAVEPAPAGKPIGPWIPVAIPVESNDVSLTDLALPASIRVPGSVSGLTSYGGFSLTSAPGRRVRTIDLPAHGAWHALLLATTLQDDASIPDGAPVAELVATSANGRQAVVLRKGAQVDDWERVGSASPPSRSTLRTGYTWTKLISLTGESSYPGSLRQFTAGMGVTTVPLPAAPYTTITLRYLAPKAILRVWAIAGR